MDGSSTFRGLFVAPVCVLPRLNPFFTIGFLQTLFGRESPCLVWVLPHALGTEVNLRRFRVFLAVPGPVGRRVPPDNDDDDDDDRVWGESP